MRVSRMGGKEERDCRTHLFVQERSDLLDERFKVAEPAVLCLDLGDLLTQLLLLCCELGALVLKVGEGGGVHRVRDLERRECGGEAS